MARGEFKPDKVRTIGTFNETRSGEHRIVINTFDGKHYVDIRQWYKKSGQDDLLPGKGMSVNVDNLDALIGLLKKAKKRAIKAGLLPEDSE